MATTFFQRVEALCMEHGMTTTDLGPAAGIGNGTVSGWRKGAVPQISTIKKVAAYFNVSVAYLTGKTDDPIDYANLDTSEFNTATYDHILKKCKGNVEQANREYLEFEKAQAQDALSEHAVYHNSGANYGLIGTAHAPVKIINGSEHTLSEQESELLRIFADLSIVEQSKVLIYAAELKDKKQ
jgi:transcriptional regulator with XRE-family HTH domain